MNTSKISWYSLFVFSWAGPLMSFMFICLAGSAVLGIFVPGLIADLSRNYSDGELFYGSISNLGILFVAIFFNRVFYELAVNKFIKLLMLHSRSMCYDRWLACYDAGTGKSSYKDKYPLGEIIARIMSDTESMRELITSGAFGIFIDLFFVISCLISFLALNLTSGLFLSGLEIVALLLLLWGSKYMRVVFHRVRASRGNVSKTIANVVGGTTETFYTNHHSYASKKGRVAFLDFLSKVLKSNVWDASYYSMAESLYPIFLALIVVIFPFSKITTIAVMFAIIDLVQRSITPIKQIAGRIVNIQRALTGFSRIIEFVDDLGREASSSFESRFIKSEGFDSIKVEIPYFEFIRKDETREKFCLKDIKFEAKKGELIGIVGMSGSGKSTLLNILSANIIPKNLAIDVNFERGIKTIAYRGEQNLEELRRFRGEVSIISQESHLFTETLAFNISMNWEVPERLVNFWKWISGEIPYLKSLEFGLYDRISPIELSLGQKQLLAAIRSCYLNKTIVLFDEISSGLDSELEKALRKAILIIQQNSLTIIVAHRLETIARADKILVMEDGELISSGVHETLLEESNLYKKFVEEARV